MQPKKSKELIPGVSQKVNLPSKTVEDIINFYWREVWLSLTSAESIKVHLTNLGDFNIKHWLIDKEINKLENFEDKTRLTGTQKYTVSIKMEEKLKTIKNLKYLLEEENQRKGFIYEHKKITSESKEEPNTDLEK